MMGTGDYGSADLVQQTVNVLIPVVTLQVNSAALRFALDKAVDKSDVFKVGVRTTLAGFAVFLLFTYPLSKLTIRVLMDEELAPKDKLKLVFKEAKVGFSNGFLLGILAIVFLGLYIFLYKGYDIRHAFLISLCVGVSLLLAMIVSSLVGTLVPLFFKKIKVDPAVASGPLITTVNDLVAVVIYYGLSWVFLIQTMHILG